MAGLVPPDGGPRLTAIVCQGVDPDTGDRCGKAYTGPWGSIIDQARAGGWRIGRLPDGSPDAMCPACGKPDPAVLALIRDIERSL